MTFGEGDLVSIFTALAFLGIGLTRPSNRAVDKIAVLLANGLAFGTLLLILLSPFSQVVGVKANLFDVAVKEEKLTLWWAAAVASVSLVQVLL